jgi:phage repressor protein C with HTH and peptisase S24 domain
MAEELSPEEAAFVRRLKEAVEKSGTVTAIAERSGVPEKTVYNWLAGTNASKAIAFAKIAAAAGASVRSLLGLPEYAETGDQSLDLAEFAVIPILDIQAGAGMGIENGEAEIVDNFPFPRALLRRLSVKPDRVRGLRSRGPSMEPTISDGGLVLVNTAREPIVDGLIYALRAPDGLRLKRIQRQMDGGILLVSDNKELFPPERLGPADAEGVKLLGRVFWAEKLL